MFRGCFCNRLGFSGQQLSTQSYPLGLIERWLILVRPLPFGLSIMGGPTRSLCSNWQNSQSHWALQATTPRQTLRMTQSALRKLQTFINSCQRKIFQSHWALQATTPRQTLRMTQSALRKLQTFINSCQRKIFHIHLPEKVINEDLWRTAKQESVAWQTLRSLPATSPGRAWLGIHMGKERGEGPGTHGTGTSRQKRTEAVTLGRSWKRQPRVWCAGGVSSMAYAPQSLSKKLLQGDICKEVLQFHGEYDSLKVCSYCCQYYQIIQRALLRHSRTLSTEVDLNTVI